MLFETQIISVIQQAIITSPFRIAVAVFLARWLVFFYVVLFAMLFVERRPRFRHAISEALWALVLALITTSAIAHVVQRARPFLAAAVTGFPVVGLIPPPFNTSFPSGHTASAFAMSAAIFMVHRRLGIVAFVMAFLIAFGRIAVGVHYPTDILGGIAVGLSAFALVRFAHHQLRTRDLDRSAAHHRHV